jgi:hypothetical protein
MPTAKPGAERKRARKARTETTRATPVQPGAILVTLALDVPQDRVYAEELDLFQTHLAELILALIETRADDAA